MISCPTLILYFLYQMIVMVNTVPPMASQNADVSLPLSALEMAGIMVL